MDTVTYPEPGVASYVVEHFVPLKLMLGDKAHSHLYRSNGIIWTPTAGFMDRNGTLHYQSPGYLPAPVFAQALRIGRARCLMAWTKNVEAAEELETAATMGEELAPEALFWLGVSRFLATRNTVGMWEAWNRLVTEYQESAWAARVYQNDPEARYRG